MENKNNTKQRKILAQLYNNNANTIKYLPFFFRNRKELSKFFNQFGGKTLVLPDTYEEFLKLCLLDDEVPEDSNMRGISESIHNKMKDRIVNVYINLYDSLEDVIIEECKSIVTNQKEV